jgi:hypothetical protein
VIPSRSRRLVFLALIPVLLSCGGDGVVEPAPAGATLSSIQSAIFTPRCALPGCHGGAPVAQGLSLEEGLAYSNLVGVPSTELPAFLRVDPGDAADSYLFMKLAGDRRIAGDPMPLVGDPLGLAELDSIRQWIESGAPDN